MADHVLTIDGEVDRPLRLALADLATMDPAFQVPDVSQLDPKRQGAAVRLEGLLLAAGVRPGARYLTLHATADNFHASVPLDAVRNRGLLIYSLYGQPLPAKAGGPLRFYIPDYAACQSHEVDECANVKFVDRIELSATKGFDNRPTDEAEHARLHQHE
jgi:DMSO/TMAO reductase YedYZ molybdopterin-dependent catalytic subunit